MPSLWITSKHTQATVRSERVVIKPNSSLSDLSSERSVPLIDVDFAVFSKGVDFSSQLVHALLKRNIPILILSYTGHVEGHFFPKISPRGLTHLEQYQRSFDPRFQSDIGSALISAKIYNQKRCLQRISKNRESNFDHKPLYLRQSRAIKKLSNQNQSTNTPDQIMGLEGATTADYYRSWARYLPQEFPFEKRSRRPPLNPVNACISFAATILYHEVLSACFVAGLDPALGQLHTTSNDRWSLALDLMEPFRPVIVESLTLDLFSRGMLNTCHFEPTEDGGIYLNNKGRQSLILQYEKRMERYFYSEHLAIRTTLRLCIQNQPYLFKRSLLTEQAFLPFKMS